MRRMLLLVAVVAVMAAMVAASAGAALAKPQEDTFTVRCSGFLIGPGEGQPFTQTLPEKARFGSAKSIEQTNQRSPEDDCRQIG